MSPAIRCLVLLVVGWSGVRAASLGIAPGSELFRLSRVEAPPRQAERALFPPLEPAVPLDSYPASFTTPQIEPQPPTWAVRPIAMPYYLPVAPRQSAALPAYYPTAATRLDASVGPIETWAPRSIAAPSQAFAASTSSAVLPPQPAPVAAKFDRLQLTAWALLRGRQTVGSAAQSLAPGGTLGASQAGARLTYRFTRELAASLRTSSAVGTSQSEVAAGIRITPLRSIPFAVTAERRQAIGDYGGQSAFAVFAEGGIYGQSLWGFAVDGYAQAGIVGLRDRALFADGAFAFTRPVYRQFSAVFGIWGGIQPGTRRIDAGPRVSYRVRPNVRVHLDWRQRLAGGALPDSGPALTLAGDF